MYEFLYEAFDFLNKFQVEVPSKIFVIENPNNFEFYYVEQGVMFTANITKDDVFIKMVEKYGEMERDEALALFRQTQFKDITEPLSVKKDIIDNKDRKNVTINLNVAEKLRNMKFDLV